MGPLVRLTGLLTEAEREGIKMSPIDLPPKVKEGDDKTEVTKFFAELELLHNDKKAIQSKVAERNEANRLLIEKKILPEITLTDEKGGEKVTIGDDCVKFMDDGTQIEYRDARFRGNATTVIRTDGSRTDVKWESEKVVSEILNTDMFGKQTKVEAKDGKTLACNSATGEITTTNADGTKTVQRTDGVVEHQDKDGKVVSMTDSAGREIAMSSSMQTRVDAAAGRISSALAQISLDPSKAADSLAELHAILAELDPLLTCEDSNVSAGANSAHVQVTSAMCAAESRSNLKATA